MSGHKSMQAWNPTWHGGNIPVWLSSRCRKILRILNLSSAGSGVDILPRYAQQMGLTALLDHYGTIKTGLAPAKRSPIYPPTIFLTQPYCAHDALADVFARSLDLTITLKTEPGPWNEGTVMYQFYPRP